MEKNVLGLAMKLVYPVLLRLPVLLSHACLKERSRDTPSLSCRHSNMTFTDSLIIHLAQYLACPSSPQKLLLYLSLRMRVRDTDTYWKPERRCIPKQQMGFLLLRSFELSVCVKHISETEHTVITDTDLKH